MGFGPTKETMELAAAADRAIKEFQAAGVSLSPSQLAVMATLDGALRRFEASLPRQGRMVNRGR